MYSLQLLPQRLDIARSMFISWRPYRSNLNNLPGHRARGRYDVEMMRRHGAVSLPAVVSAAVVVASDAAYGCGPLQRGDPVASR
jgi:hypothetical protein